MAGSLAIESSRPSLGARVSNCLELNLYDQLHSLLRDAGELAYRATGNGEMARTVQLATAAGQLRQIAEFVVDWLRDGETLAALQAAYDAPIGCGCREATTARVLMLRLLGPVRPSSETIGEVRGARGAA